MKEVNYLVDIEIDPTALDVEWIEQPTLAFRYAKLSAEMKQIMDLAKEELDLVKADLDQAIRSDPQGFGVAKITESVVSNAILTQDEYKEANNRYIEARYDFNIANAAVEAINQKKNALENLVKLNGQAYFASPSVPRDLSKEWEEKQRAKKMNEKIAKKMIKNNNNNKNDDDNTDND